MEKSCRASELTNQTLHKLDQTDSSDQDQPDQEDLAIPGLSFDQHETSAVRVKRHDHRLAGVEHQSRVELHARWYRRFGASRMLDCLARRTSCENSRIREV